MQLTRTAFYDAGNLMLIELDGQSMCEGFFVAPLFQSVHLLYLFSARIYILRLHGNIEYSRMHGSGLLHVVDALLESQAPLLSYVAHASI